MVESENCYSSVLVSDIKSCFNVLNGAITTSAGLGNTWSIPLLLGMSLAVEGWDNSWYSCCPQFYAHLFSQTANECFAEAVNTSQRAKMYIFHFLKTDFQMRLKLLVCFFFVRFFFFFFKYALRTNFAHCSLENKGKKDLKHNRTIRKTSCEQKVCHVGL